MRLDERFDHCGVEVNPGSAPQLLEGIRGRARGTVGAIGRHGIEGVHDRDDAGFERDLIPPESIGEPTPVDSLVV
jgi:hypothetical protein